MGSQSFPNHRPPSKPLASASNPPPAAAAAKAPAPPPNPNPNPNLLPPSAVVLTREEVLRRRARRLRRLHRCYLDQYWALAEEVRNKHREYYWNHGRSPVEEERSPGEGDAAAAAAAAGGEPIAERERCAYAGCKTNAMPLTRFCHTHIMSDRKQTLYKPCSYAIKSGHSGPITCGKPVLRAAVPSLCSVHFQRAQKHVSHALKKAGLSTSSAIRPAPKFHVIIAEYVRQIQAKRRGSQTAAKGISKAG